MDMVGAGVVYDLDGNETLEYVWGMGIDTNNGGDPKCVPRLIHPIMK